MVNRFEINYGTISSSIYFSWKKKVLVHLGLKCLHLCVHLYVALRLDMPMHMYVLMCPCTYYRLMHGRKALLLLLIFRVSKWRLKLP